MSLLTTRTPDDLPAKRGPKTDAETVTEVATILQEIRSGGEKALRHHAERLGDLEAGQPLWLEKADLEKSLSELPAEQQQLLTRVAERIKDFARMQRQSLQDGILSDGGLAMGHWIAPVERAGCYAPGGRYPLPSTTLMTAITAKEAGVREIWVASPHPAPITLAAAAVAGADGLLACGGAQAIAALAYGAGDHAPCDMVVGPGNKYVTVAKRLVYGDVGIDFLAGPSELVALADDQADAAVIAADLLAQAEHDDEALPILVTTCASLVESVNQELETQLTELSTAPTARKALANGFAVVCKDLEEACAVCDRIAPEHLALHVEQPEATAEKLNHYGAVFLGADVPEVLGDYGTGPNHVLPTGGGARYTGGLSVFTFLRIRTWMQCTFPGQSGFLTRDAAALARLEGLEAHARSAERRR